MQEIWNDEATKQASKQASREPSKKDSEYAFELFPYTKDQFEKKYSRELGDVNFSKTQDGFSWYYKIEDEEIVVVADYYEKKKVKTKIIQLADGGDVAVGDCWCCGC